MANPTHRHSRSRRDKRRANWKGELPTLVECPECKEKKVPHSPHPVSCPRIVLPQVSPLP